MSPEAQPTATRDRILAYLKEHHVTTVQAMSRAWQLTRADIRYHLNALVQEGLVEIIPQTPGKPQGRGRPERHFRLAQPAATANFPALAAALLETLSRVVTEENREVVLKTVASALAGPFSPNENPIQRLTRAVDLLGKHGYRARWEAGPTGPRVLLRACPYAAILPMHPELCQVDGYLIEHLLQWPVNQAARINMSTGKPPACIFTTIEAARMKNLKISDQQ